MPTVDDDAVASSAIAPKAPSHPIVTTSFDAALASPTGLGELSRNEAAREMDGYLGSLATGAKAARIAKSPDGVRLVFSDDTAAKLGTGELHIPIDRATGLPRAEARDAAGKIREGAKTSPVGSRLNSVARGVVAAAHVISSIDMMAQLAQLGEEITRLSEFMEADRRGAMRGAYTSLQRAFADTDPARRSRVLEQCALELDALQGRFLETARTRAEAIRDPLDFGLFDAVRKSQGRAKRELREQLGSAFGDLRLAEFCTLLSLEVQRELANPEAAHVITESFRSAYAPILDTLEQKARYLDFTLADEVSRKAAALRLTEQSGGLLDVESRSTQH